MASGGTKRGATPAEAEVLLAGNHLALVTFGWVCEQVDALGGAQLRVARTQVGWARRRGFVFIWSARAWLGARGADCVLSLAMDQAHPDPRWKQVVAVRPTLWMHHLEVRDPGDLDPQVAGWLAIAYRQAQ